MEGGRASGRHFSPLSALQAHFDGRLHVNTVRSRRPPHPPRPPLRILTEGLTSLRVGGGASIKKFLPQSVIEELRGGLAASIQFKAKVTAEMCTAGV